MYLSIVFQALFEVKLDIPLKLMHYESYDFNNVEHYSFTLMKTCKQTMQTWCKVG